MLADKATLERDLNVLLENESARKEQNKTMRQEIVNDIECYYDNSKAEFDEAYEKIIDINFIVAAIKEKGVKKKKDDLELLVDFLGAKLEGELDKILSKYSFELSESVNKYLHEFEVLTTANGKIGVDASIPFNAKRIFVSGMAGLLTFGGLTLWASTLGNLAGYIIVAKGVSLLAALGISLGGTAAVMPFVAAIGGPITLFIVAAIIVTGIFLGILSSGWQKRVARNIVDEYKKVEAAKQYNDFIKKFWTEDTIAAFNTAANAMEQEWLHLIETHQGLLNNYDTGDIQRKIKEIGDMKSFLSNIPVQGSG